MQGARDLRANALAGTGDERDGTRIGHALGLCVTAETRIVTSFARNCKRKSLPRACSGILARSNDGSCMSPITLPTPDADALAHSRLVAMIGVDILASGGSIPFSRYMELALYAPGLGYYSAGATKFGAAGDFVTAPELGSLFAQCVAEAVAPVLRGAGPEAEFIELGGGSGAFALDALTALASRRALPRRYAILEPSADLRERQRERLSKRLPEALSARVEWLDRPLDEPWHGVLFANEVIDALPTPRGRTAK